MINGAKDQANLSFDFLKNTEGLIGSCKEDKISNEQKEALKQAIDKMNSFLTFDVFTRFIKG